MDPRLVARIEELAAAARPSWRSWRSSPAVRDVAITTAAAPESASTGVLLRHEVERRSGGDQLLLLGAVFEVADDAMRMLHHPPADVALVDRFPFLRIFLQVGNAGEAERQFRIVEMLLPLEVDLEV